LTGQRYSILKGIFTTCACEGGTPDWSITGNQMDMHMGESGTARNAHFDILGYPVLYFPYAEFPADSDRHSGFLSPRIGESGLRGAQLVQPYYLDINRSSDATIAFDVETSQRIGGLAEYRLVTGEDNYFAIDGAFYDESIRSEQNRQQDIIDTQIANPNIPYDRYDAIGMTRQHITPDLVLYGDTVTVSDPLELREMNVWTLSRTAASGVFFPNNFFMMRQAPSDFGLLDSFQNGYVKLGGEFDQDLIQQQQFVPQILPELQVSGRKDFLGNLFYSDYDFSADNFARQEGQSGLRFDLNPQVTLPWRLGDYIYGFGTIGGRETVYDTGGDVIDVIPVGTHGRIWNNGLALGPLVQGGLQARELVYTSAGIATELEKVYDLHWESLEKIKHTIEPFANYTYIPNVDQSSLPLFDEVDRIEGRSLFEYGVTSRIFARLSSPQAAPAAAPTLESDNENEAAAGTNPFRARGFADGAPIEELFQLTVMQAYDTTHPVTSGSSTHFSDLDISGIVFPTRVWSLGGQIDYSPQQSAIHYGSVYLNFQPWWTRNVPRMYMGRATTGSFLQLSYNYIGPGPESQPGVNAGFSQFLMLRAYYDLFDRLGVFYAPSYDFVSKQMIQSEYGVRLKSPCDCWSFDVGITQSINPSETQLQFQLTLGGLGSIGRSPFGRNPFQTHVGVLPNFE
jgi:LPS transport system D/LptD protein